MWSATWQRAGDVAAVDAAAAAEPAPDAKKDKKSSSWVETFAAAVQAYRRTDGPVP